jgi:hypothetical protein
MARTTSQPLPDPGSDEYHARELLRQEIAAAIQEKAEGWKRTFEGQAEHLAKDGRCTCPEKQEAGASEFDHFNMDCPVAIYLRMARLVVEDSRPEEDTEE